MYKCLNKLAALARRCLCRKSLAALIVLAFPTAVLSQQGLRIELNKLETVENACRAYMVFENQTGAAFDALMLDLVMFDPDGVINKRLAVDGAPLPIGKTSVKLFDIKDISCEQVSRMLLNDVLNCGGPGGERTDCLQQISTASRSDVLFFK